jgi:Protein of unknown function (DUF3096)
MMNSLAVMSAGFRPRQFHPIHRARHRSRERAIHVAAICGIFGGSMEPVEAKSVFYSGTLPTGKLPPSIRFPHIRRRPSMTITAVQIPAIVALLAGVLILIMPRFLNFIVAIYLILVGLHGLGIFRSLHM